MGALGAIGGPDKGLRYLLEAWKRLDYKDATLALGGSHSQTPWVQQLVQRFFEPTDWWASYSMLGNQGAQKCPTATRPSGAQVRLLGWVDKVSDFYNGISLLVQPSVSEGFGLEVLEAMAHGRAVLCSTGAGAADVVPKPGLCDPCNSGALANHIAYYHDRLEALATVGTSNQKEATAYTWDRIRARYVDVWRSLL